jgi:hypothetical protein
MMLNEMIRGGGNNEEIIQSTDDTGFPDRYLRYSKMVAII